MSEYSMPTLALSPLLLMVFLALKLKMPTHYSVLVSLVFTAALLAIFWEMPVQNLRVTIGYGTLEGLQPIVIMILGAIFSYNVTQATKMLDILRDILASINEGKRVQVLLVSWCFDGSLEAAADCGMAVTTPIDILITLGSNPLKAAVASFVANTVPAVFGAVGIPVSILARQVNLPVYTLGGTTILQLVLFSILLPSVTAYITDGGLKAIRGVFLITLICGTTTLVLQYLVAIHPGAELPAFVDNLVSLFVVAVVSRLRKEKTDPKRRIEVSHTRETTPHPAKVLFRVSSIYLFIFVFILLYSPPFPTIEDVVSQPASVLHFTLADGKIMALKVEWVTTPGALTIFATIISGFIQGASARGMLEVFIRTTFQLKDSIVVIMAVAVLVATMDLSGIIPTLAQSIVDLTGSSYVFLVPTIGALGTFVTGSDTNSNILFGKLQTIATSKLYIDPNWLATTNAPGATGGKMISPQSTVTMISATKTDGQANQIMPGTVKYCCAYTVTPGLKVGPFYYWFMT